MRPLSKPLAHPLPVRTMNHHQPLTTHRARIIAHTTAPPHLIVLRMRGCGFIPAVYRAASTRVACMTYSAFSAHSAVQLLRLRGGLVGQAAIVAVHTSLHRPFSPRVLTHLSM